MEQKELAVVERALGKPSQEQGRLVFEEFVTVEDGNQEELCRSVATQERGLKDKKPVECCE